MTRTFIAKIDFPKSIIAIIDFRKSIVGSQLLGLGQSEQSVQSESRFCRPQFQTPQLSDLGPAIRAPQESNIGLWKQKWKQKPTLSNPSRSGVKPTSSNPSPPSNPNRPRIRKRTNFQPNTGSKCWKVFGWRKGLVIFPSWIKIELRWPVDSNSRESIRREKPPIFITCERFAWITSNLQFAIFSPPTRDSPERGTGSVREPWNDSRESGNSRESDHLSIRTSPQTALLMGKSLMSVIFRPQFWGRKWLCQVYGRLGLFWFFLQKKTMFIKFLVLGGGGVWGFWKGGLEVQGPILFLWARRFF